MTTTRERASSRGAVGRILVLADRSAEGRSARRWAARWARDREVDIVSLPARDELHAVIPAQRGDLLVLGLHTDRDTLPATIEDVIDEAPCPTVVFRTATGEPRCVTAALTDDHTDADVIRTAARLAETIDRPLLLVHGRPLPLHRSETPAERKQGHQVLRAAREFVREIAPGLVVGTELIRGHGQDAVTRRARDELVVVGAGGGSGLGLVTRAALHHSPAPVVVVKARERGQP